MNKWYCFKSLIQQEKFAQNKNGHLRILKLKLICICETPGWEDGDHKRSQFQTSQNLVLEVLNETHWNIVSLNIIYFSWKSHSEKNKPDFSLWD